MYVREYLLLMIYRVVEEPRITMAARKVRREKRMESFGNVGDMLGMVHNAKSHTTEPAGIMIMNFFLNTQNTMHDWYVHNWYIVVLLESSYCQSNFLKC